MPPIAVGHGSKRDRSDRSRQVHFDHAPVNDEHNADGKRVHSQPHKNGLEPQPEQFSRAKRFKPCFDVADHGIHIKRRVSDDNTGTAVDNALTDIENPHDDIPCVRYDHHGAEGFEYPLEEHPSVYIVHIVFLCYELDQLITHHKSKDNPGYRHNDRFGDIADHGIDAAVP